MADQETGNRLTRAGQTACQTACHYGKRPRQTENKNGLPCQMGLANGLPNGFGEGGDERRVKFNWVRRTLRIEKPNFFYLQETKLNTVDLKWVRSLMEYNSCEFIQKEKVGKSVGQLLIWDSIYFDASNVIMFDRVIGIRGKWKATGEEFNIINVYGPHEDANKKKLWESLSSLLKESDEAWILWGDFNEVGDSSERLNCEFIVRRARKFNDFIDINNLLETPLGGRLFTRVSDDRVKFSKLDRFLVSKKFIHMWGELAAVALDRKHSDYCPIILKDDEKNFSPKPFKVFDAWFDDVGVNEVVSDA
ncbi:uncharacterized protein [Rutidosis leptorrhynchoides]|uniref:uncharacterized protein n=1 Tax=Rutidosis leptorrhynchoides TaxID=125765 RepID=UPI003A98FE6D